MEKTQARYQRYNYSEKGKARTAKGNAKKVAEKKQENQKKLEKVIDAGLICAKCGKPFTGKSLRSQTTLTAKVHQGCDPVLWARINRLLKQQKT